MKVYIHIGGFTKFVDMPFKPETGETIYFSRKFENVFLQEIATSILNNYDIYKEYGKQFLNEDMHHMFIEDISMPWYLSLHGFNKIEKTFWDMDDQEVRYNISVVEDKSELKYHSFSEQEYIRLLKSAAGIY